MTKKAIESRVSGDAANVTLDNRLRANWLRHGVKGGRKYTLREISDAMGKASTAVTTVTLHRLTRSKLDQVLSTRAKFADIAGLDGLAIRKLFDTPLAREAMSLEWKLRSADFNRYPASQAMLLITEAEAVVEKMDAAASRDELTATECLVHGSLGAQVATYKARVSGPKQITFYQDAKARLLKTAERRTTILDTSLSSAFTDTVLSVRMESLAYFVEYNLHDQKDRNSDLATIARRVASPRVLRAVETVTKALGDPRIPINFAEAAGRVGLMEGTTAKGNAHNQRAADMLSLALETANYCGPVKDFAPDWLRGYDLSSSEELQAAIKLLDLKQEAL